MNHENTLIDLLRWSQDELFYREYHRADEEKRARMLEEADPSLSAPDRILHPDHDPFKKLGETSLTNGQSVCLASHPRYMPFFTYEHAYYEMLYALTGECDLVLDGIEKHFKQGDVCLIAPEVNHGVKVFGDSVVISVFVRPSTIMDIFMNAVRDKSQLSSFFLGSIYDNGKLPYIIYHSGVDGSLRDYLLSMYEEQDTGDVFSDRVITSLLTVFIASLTRFHSGDIEFPENRSNSSLYSEELMSYILSHFDTVTLNSLADHFHFSVPYCSKLVKTSCGLSFSVLLTRIRMQQGLTLLETTKMSIADISEHVGYKNPETFIRCFTRTFNKTPSQFRRRG